MFYSSVLVIAVGEGIMFSNCPSHYCEGNISGMLSSYLAQTSTELNRFWSLKVNVYMLIMAKFNTNLE